MGGFFKSTIELLPDPLRERMVKGLVGIARRDGTGITPRKKYIRKLLRYLPPRDMRVVLENVYGFRMELSPYSTIEKDVMVDSVFELRNSELIRSALFEKPEGAVFLDLGANVGYFSLLAAGVLAPRKGRVVAIEPVPPSLERLRRNVSLNEDLKGIITVKGVAVSDSRKTLTLSMPVSTRGFATFSAAHRGGESISFDVPADTLDGCIDGETAGKVAFIKMDIEGAETLAIKGMECVLENGPDVLLSLHPLELAELGGTVSAILGYFSNKGYTLYAIEGGGLKPFKESSVITYTDVFMRRDGGC
ncbi:MAG: FkbM family methyltransferase [Thermodesulfobacteriota bacterium]